MASILETDKIYSQPIVEIEHLSKSYGRNKVLEDVTVNLQAGQIIGLLGPNGCGKTSLIKIITGLIKDYHGSVKIGGYAPGIETKSMVAYLPEKTYLANWMRPIDAINYFDDFFADFDKAKALEMMDHFNLPLKQKARSMSKGMQEKLQLLLVMSRKAQLYVLDEPLGGIDAAARSFILDTLVENFSKNSTVLISTHQIHDMEKIFDHVLMIGKGQVLLDENADVLKANGNTIEDVFKEVFHYAWEVN